jgi:FkbM family methyltransferase
LPVRPAAGHHAARVSVPPLRHRLHRALFVAATWPPIELAARTYGRVHRPCSYVGDHTLFTQTVFGHLVFLDTRDTSLLPSLVAHGYWEAGVTRLLLRLLRPGQRVVEVGANVGYYTLLFASRVGPHGSVTAFEANPRTVELLRRTLATNGLARAADVVPTAVCDRPGRATLHRLARQQGSSSLYAFGPDDLAAWDDEASPLDVETTSLDAHFGPDAPPVDLVKIDAEGAEPAIVAGMPRLLARSPHVRLVMEFIPAQLRRAGHDPRGFLASLASLGFRVHTIDARGRVRAATVDRLVASSAEELLLTR